MASLERLIDVSEALASLVERGAAGVARVDGRRRGPSSATVWSRDGVLVASSHGVADDGVEVGLHGGDTLPAELVGRDPTTDLAVLKVARSDLVPPEWSDAPLRVGQLVVGLARPGRGPRASLGMVSRLGDAWRSPSGGRIDRYVETDLPLRTGFSGGPLLDLDGRAVGLSTAGIVRSVALAVPGATLRRVVAALLAHGQIRRGYIGVATIPVRLPSQVERQAGRSSALLVTAVEEDSPASRAGLELGDVLLSAGGLAVSHAGDLLPLVEEEHIGEAVPARIWRGGSVRDVLLAIGARGSAKGAPQP